MNKKNFVFALIIVSIFLLLGRNLTNAGEADLFDEIVNKTGSNVIEYGVRASFITESIENGALKDILKTMGYYDSNAINISSKGDIYTINFTNGAAYGFIESAKVEGKTYVTIDIKEKGAINNINILKGNIEKAIGNKYRNVKYYLYLKSQLKQDDLSKVNNEIKEILKSRGAKDIDTIKISNGFSTVAYTKDYEVIRNNGKLIDFNYAVASYNTGSYIIIGTPVIKVEY